MNMKKQIYTSYKRQNKWLGLIDYKSLLFVIIYGISIILILKKMNLNFIISLYIFIILMSPLIVLVFINTRNGSAIDIIYMVITYFFKNKKYVNLKYYSNDKRYIYKNNVK